MTSEGRMSLRERLEEAVCDNCPAADECGGSIAPLCDLKFKVDAILAAVADEVERMPLVEPSFTGTALNQRTNIAALLRKGGKENQR